MEEGLVVHFHVDFCELVVVVEVRQDLEVSRNCLDAVCRMATDEKHYCNCCTRLVCQQKYCYRFGYDNFQVAIHH